MKTELRSELWQHAWEYFDRHAEQRLKTFNFYLILSGALVAGFFAVARDHGSLRYASSIFLLLSIISFVFWKLDIRNRDLTRHSEEALKSLEDEYTELPNDDEGLPHRCKLFQREEAEFPRENRASKMNLIFGYYSYTTCFQLIFSIFGFGGLLIAALLLVFGG